MQLEKMTTQLQAALADAQSLAIGCDNTAVEPEHILLALLNQQSNSVKPMLAKAGFKYEKILQDLEKRVDGFAELNQPTGEI